MRTVGVFLAGVALAVSAITATSAGPAGAAVPASHVEQVGKATLFQNTDFTGLSDSISYPRCSPGSFPHSLPRIGSFENNPPPSCQLSLVGPAGRFTLCAGRGTVPTQFRQSPTVQIKPGLLTKPCRVAGSSGD